MPLLNDIINKIKQKKELQGVSNEYVLKLLDKYTKSPLANSKQEKQIIKLVREELRIAAGQYIPSELHNHDVSELVKLHKSTQERLPYYNTLKEIIKKINPKSIIDLGCGLNPLVLAEQGIEYYACDIRQDIIDIINNHFNKNKIKGKAFYQDVTDIQIPLPKVDLCLMLKLVDLIDRKNHKPTEELLNKIQAKNIIISFSTKTLSGKPMRHPQRGWIEQLSRRLGFKFNIVTIPNEIYYILSKG